MAPGLKRGIAALIGSIAMLPAAGATTASGADLGEAFEPEPGSVVTSCGPRWWNGTEYLRRCGQSSAGYGRTGYYHSSTNQGVWDTWRPTVSTRDLSCIALATDGVFGQFLGYPQFRRASDGHVLTHGTQVIDTSKGQKLRVGYFDHQTDRFTPTATVGEPDPHLYPTDPRPTACS
jgi:hypothetical protein